MEWGPQTVVLFAGLAVSAATDAWTGKILNMVTFPMMALGVVINAVERDPWFGLAGLGLATLVHYPLWLGGIHKAGDVKLLMGLGACAGWAELAEATVWLAVFYVPVALVVLGVRGRLGNLVRAGRWQLDKLRGLAPTGPEPEKTWFRTGPLIAFAGLIGWLTNLALFH